LSDHLRVLFVCVGNACRSQMAEALARHHASDVIEPFSAGISPLGTIADGTRLVLLERGIGIGEQRSKGPSEADIDSSDLIVNMTGIPGKALFQPGLAIEDWEIGDPYGEDLAIFRTICDEIEVKILDLAERLRARGSEARTA
jgi:arsenate reductase